MADRTRKKKPSIKNPQEQTDMKSRFGGLLGRNNKTDGATPKPKKTETVAGNGTVILSKGAMLGKITAWTLVGFVLVISLISAAQLLNPPAQAEQVKEATDTPATQQAGDYARGFVGAWLRATKADASELTRYRSISQGEITANVPTEFRDIAIASAETDENGLSTVIVSADVLTKTAVEGQVTTKGQAEQKSEWLPSWFQVNIQKQSNRFTPLGWPAPIPTPQTGTSPRTAYSYAGSKDIETTIEAFFRAYALDEGDVSRMTNPKSTIQALGPSPYTTVKIANINTDKDHEDVLPADGTVTRALVNLSLGTGEDTARAATYALSLETRGGRWEVLAIDSSPALSLAQDAKPVPTDQMPETP